MNDAEIVSLFLSVTHLQPGVYQPSLLPQQVPQSQLGQAWE